jgi:hypothetical protein
MMSPSDGPEPWRRALQEIWEPFRRGLIVPSMLSTIICLACAAVYLVSLFGLVNEELILRQGDRILAQKGTDYDFFVTREAMRLQRASIDTPMLVLTGASTTRCTLLRPELEEAFRARSEQPPRLFKLCANNQPVLGSVAWWDAIPDGARGYLVVGVSPGTLRHGQARLVEDYLGGRFGLNLPLVTEALAHEGRTAPLQAGFYGVDHARFLLSRAMLPLKRTGQQFKPVKEVEALTHGKEPLGPDELKALKKRASGEMASMQPEDTAEALRGLREGIEKLRRRTSLKIVLFETPVTSSFVDEGQLRPLFQRVNAQVAELAGQLGVTYMNVNTELAIPESAFYDMVHLRDPEWTSRCAGRVVDRVLEGGANEGVGAVKAQPVETRGQATGSSHADAGRSS